MRVNNEDTINVLKQIVYHHNYEKFANSKSYAEGEWQLIYNYILQKMAEGKSKRTVLKETSEEVGIKDNAARNWYNKAINSLIIDNEETISAARTKALERLEHVAKEAIKKGHYPTALKAYDQMNKINGLYTEKQEVEVKTDEPIEIKFN